MTLRRIADATVEPITAAEARLWCRADDDDPRASDAVFNRLIATFRRHAEAHTKRRLTGQQWEQIADKFPPVEFDLGAAPVSAIDFVKYIDEVQVEQTLSSSAYVLDNVSRPCFILPAYGYEWPATGDHANAVTVRFTQPAVTDSDLDLLATWMQMNICAAWEISASLVSFKVEELPNRFTDRLLDDMIDYSGG